jgi:GNAT superfamily N-acetyltransferase
MSTFKIVPYQPLYQEIFGKLNRAWLEKYFWVEPLDEQVLSDPDTHILAPGGAILVALENQLPIGVVALKYSGNAVFEMTKMAVEEGHQGKGYGKLLCLVAINKALEMKADRLILYSNTSLKTAIGIYKKLGWVEIPQTEQLYARSDIKMEYPLKKVGML